MLQVFPTLKRKPQLNGTIFVPRIFKFAFLLDIFCRNLKMKTCLLLMNKGMSSRGCESRKKQKNTINALHLHLKIFPQITQKIRGSKIATFNLATIFKKLGIVKSGTIAHLAQKHPPRIFRLLMKENFSCLFNVTFWKKWIFPL